MARFYEVEKLVAKSSRSWAEFSLDELEEMWSIAKESLRK
jgi:uncharacterized protein YabN with tetrapyrrole methylase and pyrophosphatase domain